MTRSAHLVQRCRASFTCLALILMGMFFFHPTFTVAAQQGYESPPVFSASKILPPESQPGVWSCRNIIFYRS